MSKRRFAAIACLALAGSAGWVYAQSTGEIADIPPISGEINPGGTTGTRSAARTSADPSTRAARCGDGFCTAGETAATCPVDCPGAYGECGPANGTTVSALPIGPAACDVGNQSVSDGLGNGGQYRWFCQGALAASPECMALRIIPPQCGAANGGSSVNYPTGSPACAIGTQISVDSAGTDGAYNWSCRGINTAQTVSCSATNIGLPPICRTYGGRPATQPAANSATGCDRWNYADAADTSTEWRWTCTNPNTSASVSCAAQRARNCTAAAQSWTVGTASCSGTAPATLHGQPVTATNVSSGRTGTGNFTCDDGGFVPATGSTCSWIPPTVSVTATPASVVAGGSASVTWTVSNATQCTASGRWSGNKSPSGGTRARRLVSRLGP